MIVALALSLGLSVKMSVVFVGNSHTQFNDVPGSVGKLLNRERGVGPVQGDAFIVGLLNQWESSPGLTKRIEMGGIDVAVLQGAEVSSSHRYTYSQTEGIRLGKRLRKVGARVFLVSEWPRRGWDEAEYTEAVYREMAKEIGAEVIPVGRVWDGVRKRMGGVDLWQADGNHANAMGSYLSARTIGFWLGGRQMDFVPAGVSPDFVRTIDIVLSEVSGS